MKYYYTDENQQPVGPFTAGQMFGLHQDGTVDDNSWVIEEGAAEWKPYASVFPAVPSAPPAGPGAGTCPACGSGNVPTALFCEACGARLGEPADAAVPECDGAAAAPPAPGPGLTKHAFISHSSRDHEVALRVCEVLEGRGLDCWIAPRDIDPGAPYDEEIIRGIECSQTFILLLSDASNASPHVKRELMRALRAGHAVYPIRIQEVEPGPKLEYLLEGIHWVDAWTPPLEAHLERLAELIAAGGQGTGVKHPAARRNLPGGPLWKQRRGLRTFARIAATALVLGAVAWAAVTWKTGIISGIVGYVTRQVDARLARPSERERMGPAGAPRPASTTSPAAREDTAGGFAEMRKHVRVDQAVTLSWFHDPAADKSFPSCGQVLDAEGHVIGEIRLDATDPEKVGSTPYYHTVTLTFQSRAGSAAVCVFRHDDAVTQTRVGSAEGLFFSAQLMEIKRCTRMYSVPNTVDILTVRVAVMSSPPQPPGSVAGSSIAGEIRTPVEQTILLNWAHDPKAEKKYPSASQVLDRHGDVVGELALVGKVDKSGFGECVSIPLTFTHAGGETNLCAFRFDDAVDQVRAGKSIGISFECRVKEITRIVLGYAGVGSFETITVEVTAKRPL